MYHTFPHYLLNDTIFGKTLLNIKCAFWFSLQRLSEIFLVLSRIQRSITVNVHTSSCRIPVILPWKLLGQTATSGCDGFPMFREIAPFPSSWFGSTKSGDLKYTQRRVGNLVSSFGTTKPPTHPEDGTQNPKRRKNLHILTRLFARENLIEFSRRKRLKTYTRYSCQILLKLAISRQIVRKTSTNFM